MQNWYVVHTLAESEPKVADALWQKGIENYYPITTVVQKIGGISRELVKPVFDSLIFVRTIEEELWKLKHVKRVLNIMYWLSAPAVIQDEELELIKKFIREHKCVRAEPIEHNSDEIARIVREPITLKDNISFTTLTYDERLLLPGLCYTLISSIRSGEIITINNTEDSYLYAQKS